jgi:hypothetical protein
MDMKGLSSGSRVAVVVNTMIPSTYSLGSLVVGDTSATSLASVVGQTWKCELVFRSETSTTANPQNSN